MFSSPGRRFLVAAHVLKRLVCRKLSAEATITPAKPLTVFVRVPYAQEGSQNLSVLRKSLASSVKLYVGDMEAKIDPPADTDVYVAKDPLEKDLKIMKPKCRLIVVPYAGILKVTQEKLQKTGLLVGNLHHNAGATAEMALSLLLACAKHVIRADQLMRKNDWSARGLPINPETGKIDSIEQAQFEGKKMVVVGYGQLGKRVARMGVGLGMQVTALRGSLGKGAGYTDEIGVRVRPSCDLVECLKDVRALVLCCPGTSDTIGMIGARELELMPESAILVNVGRGPVVDEEALYNALKNRSIFAAGIDTWYNYPKDFKSRSSTAPSKFPFSELNNVIMSPHRGGGIGCAEVEELRMMHLADGLNKVAGGRDWPHLFSLKAGY
eukprot:jgi/Bigna1/131817/aug1.15_g6525